jgi:hypothetical protein
VRLGGPVASRFGAAAYTAAAVTKGKREAIADWLMLLGAPILLGSLFLTWSHQFSPGLLAHYGGSPALQGVPHDPTAWQLYSAADVLLALVAGGLLVVALRGTRNARLALVPALAVAVAFTLHALGSPPTNGADIFNAALGRYAADAPAAGPGETVALVGLGLGLTGTLLAFTAD